MHIEELHVQGSALVTAVEDCPEIASGDGSVVTARFLTRQVDVIARVEILGPYGQIETLEGTTIHPVWSEDRQDWVPLGELQRGETLRAASGPAMVQSVAVHSISLPVYNIEVHGEHVYQTGELGLLVHNTLTCIGRMEDLKAFDGIPADIIDTWRKTGLGDNIPWSVNRDWILERWRRGDSFAIATDPSKLPPVHGGFKNGVTDGYFTAKERQMNNLPISQ